MKHFITLLIGIIFPMAMLAQHRSVPDKKDRIYLGDNIQIKGDWDLLMGIARNLEYIDLPEYSGDYDAQFWNQYPFGIKLVATEMIMSKENHMEHQDKNILIWLSIYETGDNLDCMQLLNKGWEYVSSYIDTDKTCFLRDHVTCMPAEYSRTNFNADSTLTFNLDMAGNSVNDRYNHHKGILICKKNALSIRMDCFLTDEGLKNFDSKYLKDIEKMFRFKELEAQK